LLTAVIILAAALITMVITGVAVVPIKRLVKATEKVSEGELGYKVKVKSSDEIGQLTNSFNKMTDDLLQSRNELIKAKEYTDNIIHSLVDMLIVVGPKGKIRTINPATEKILGFKDKELVGNPVEVLFQDVDKAQEVRKFMRRQLVREGYTKGYELNFKTKDDKVVPVIFSGSTMLNQQGEFEGIVGIAKDITDRKKSEQLIEQKNVMLEDMNQNLLENEKMLKTMLKDLKKTHEDLQKTQFQLFQSEKLKVIGQLASGVAHEVKNPLAIILQGVEYISKKTPEDNQTIQEVVKDIRLAIHRADTVIKGVLDYSTLSELNMELMDINTVIDITLLLVKYELDQHKVEIVRKKPARKLPKVTVDKNKLEQVFINIILNSIQALKTGGKIEVNVGSKILQDNDFDNPEFFETSMRPDDEVLFVEIHDSGPGIPENIMKRVFDPFFTTKAGEGGTGLGLAIIKSIIDMHKGIIMLRNHPEGGLVSTILLKV